MDAKLSTAFWALLKRDLRLAYRHRNELFNPLFFFVLVVMLFPLGTSPEKELLMTMAPGVIWVAALLASMLSLDTLFRADFEDGTLEQILLSPHPLSVLVLAKIIAHWLVTGFPMILLAPLLAVFMLSGSLRIFCASAAPQPFLVLPIEVIVDSSAALCSSVITPAFS